MSAISKFSYLRELLDDQPKKEITGLPFSEEGYNKAIEILKKKYGNISEIIQAHGREILKLPTITTVNLKQIDGFYRSLNVSVNSLKTLEKLDTAEILVLETLEKLGPIKADLIRTDTNWQSWGFEKLLEALRDYTLRNPEKDDTPNRTFGGPGRTKQFNRKERHYRSIEKKPNKCVYCESSERRSSECSNRFTRVPFGCVSSPFLLGATLQEHLNTLEQNYPETVAELRNDLYVDDVISGGTCEQEVTKVKEEAKEIFGQGGFILHKWHCSVASLEEPENNDSEQTYAKESLGTKTGEAKILGLKWNKLKDTLAVDLQVARQRRNTQREES